MFVHLIHSVIVAYSIQLCSGRLTEKDALEETNDPVDSYYFNPNLNEEDCPSADSVFLPQKNYVPWGLPDRASITLPCEVFLAKSYISGAGQGVFAATFIRKYTWLGEYEGEVVLTSEYISDYAWQIHRQQKVLHYIDGYDYSTSNWLRWLNCPRTKAEENVQVLECKGKIYYLTFKDVAPGQELLVYYGNDYAIDLGISSWM